MTVADAIPPIEPAQFDPLFDYVRPDARDQRWTAIPWEADLWEARRRSAAENRPLFIWAMNGNPLGCV